MAERTKSATVTLAIGLALNIALGVSKLVVGLLSHSTAVSSDALNNLSDAAVSVVTIIAVALSARKADKQHPYGHGRYEYIATFVLGAVIVAVGIEVLRGGIERAITPEQVAFDAAMWAVLGASIGVKAFMAVFYTVRGRLVKSDTLKAAAVDSISDVAVTSVVLACALAERFTGVKIDGYVSIAVSVVILVFAVRILKSTVSRLLGERPDAELVKSVDDILNSSPLVLSTHDLIINDYGADNKIAEVDAVFSAELGFLEVHAECDALERKVAEKTGVRLCIHADPLITGDERLVRLREAAESVLGAFGATAHDVAIDDESRRVSLDILVSETTPVNEVKEMICAAVKQTLPDYTVEIDTDFA